MSTTTLLPEIPRDAQSIKNLGRYKIRQAAKQTTIFDAEEGPTWKAFMSLPPDKMAAELLAVLLDADKAAGGGGKATRGPSRRSNARAAAQEAEVPEESAPAETTTPSGRTPSNRGRAARAVPAEGDEQGGNAARIVELLEGVIHNQNELGDRLTKVEEVLEDLGAQMGVGRKLTLLGLSVSLKMGEEMFGDNLNNILSMCDEDMPAMRDRTIESLQLMADAEAAEEEGEA